MNILGKTEKNDVTKYNEEKQKKYKFISPIEYSNTEILKNGLCLAKLSSGLGYHLYSKKGRLEYEFKSIIIEVQSYENSDIMALKLNHGSYSDWHIVDVDYENNILKPLYGAINEVREIKAINALLLFDSHVPGSRIFFSLKEKKEMMPVVDQCEAIHVKKEGFVRNKLNGKYSFWDLNGNQILDWEWDGINVKEGFLQVMKYEGNHSIYGLYSLEGKEIFPCEYWESIIPFRMTINQDEIMAFVTYKLTWQHVDKVLNMELLTIDKESILSLEVASASLISLHDGNYIVIVESDRESLYKIERNENQELKAKLIFEADKIVKLSESGLYEVWKGKKKSICNKEGEILKSIKPKRIFGKLKK